MAYITASGRSQFLDFLSELENKDFDSYSYFQETVRPLLEKDPFELGPPIWEGLGGGFFEISWGRYRAYCSIVNPRKIMLYVGVRKLWRVFRHRSECERGRADVEGGDYDQEKRYYLYLDLCKRRKKNGLS